MCEWRSDSVNSKMQSQQGRVKANDTDSLYMNEMSASTSGKPVGWHFRINISQLFVIGAAKVSHFEILCRVYEIIPNVGLFWCFYVNFKRSRWMSFSKRFDNAFDTAKHVIKDPDPVAADFNEQDYATLVAHPSSFQKFPEEILCLVGLSRHYTLDEETYPWVVMAIKQVLLAVGRMLTYTVFEDVAHVQPKRQRKRKFVVVDAGGASHPPKKLREGYGTPSETSVSGKARSMLKRLLAGAVLNAKVSVAAMPTLPFMTASISSTPEREGRDYTNSTTWPNLRVIGAPPSMTNGSRLDDGRFCRKMVDKFAPPKFFTSVCGMEHDQLFIKFNVGAARQMSLSVEVRMRAEYNVKEKKMLKSVAKRQDETDALKERNAILKKERNALDVKVTELEASAVSKERELTDLNALVTYVKSQNDILVDRVHEVEISSFGLQEKVKVYESCMDQLDKFQDDRMKVVNEKFDKLYIDFIEMALHLEEKFYPHLFTTVFGRRWLLTHDIELTIVKFLNSPKYIFALGAAIGKAIEKGMRDGLSVGIVHGKEGRALTDVPAHNPSAKVDYTSALQQLQNVNFSLLMELKSNKDASVEAMMNILHKFVLGATSRSLALDVSSFWVQKRSALRDVFVPLAGPFFRCGFDSSIDPILVDDYEVVGYGGPSSC
uniref:Transposase (Putative), gypsy type n=1 Tax=Tanacetum cinerariifolium TaxID=118510 RepID=A0A699H4Z9_TANCI|nr:hypothetical protein [Tanacetum cinerariifolium]